MFSFIRFFFVAKIMNKFQPERIPSIFCHEEFAALFQFKASDTGFAIYFYNLEIVQRLS